MLKVGDRVVVKETGIEGEIIEEGNHGMIKTFKVEFESGITGEYYDHELSSVK